MMERDAQTIRLASRQGGVISRAQALEIGLSRRQIEYRLSKGGWERIGDLGYRLIPATEPHQLLEATTVLVPGAVASHESAAHVHLSASEPAVPIVSVHSRTTHDLPGVDVRRCHDIRDSHVMSIDGLPVTTPERMIFDLAATHSVGSLSWMVGRLTSDGHLTLPALERVVSEIGRRGKPGTARMRELLETLDVGSSGESVLERRGRRLLEAASCVCGYESEYPIPWSPRRRFDDAFPAHRLAIEWDSVRFHGQRDAFEVDRARDRSAVEHGWRVIRFTWEDVTARPNRVVETVRRILSCDSSGPTLS